MRRRMFAMILALMMILSLPLCVSAEQKERDELVNLSMDVPYRYPITPADKDWANFKTSKEMYDSCQIPDHVLTSMATDALLETVLNYPFLGTYRCYDDYEFAARYLCGQFNGLEELFARDDLTETLLERYAKSKVLTQKELNENSHLRLGYVNTFFESNNLEFLIAYDQLHNGQYSKEESETFSILFSEKEQLREEQSSIYSGAAGTYAAVTERFRYEKRK